MPPIILQIYYSNRFLGTSDPTFDMWQPTLITQAVQCLSIVTACVPYLKPFLDSLESGQWRMDDGRRIGKGDGRSVYRDGGGHSSINTKRKSRALSMDALKSAASHRSKWHELVDISVAQDSVRGHSPTAIWDGPSHGHGPMLIQQTKTWEVEVEARGSHT